MARAGKIIFFGGLFLGLFLSFFVLTFLSQTVLAASVNVEAVVPSTAVCGNNILESGEECEQSSHCSANQVCNQAICQCYTPSTGTCTPGPAVCSWGSCINGVQTGSCSNGCIGWTETRSCGEFCGNGVVDGGEECDDGNSVDNDCCSNSCQRNLLIGNISQAAALNSAVIEFQTLCGVSISALEWGRTSAVDEGVYQASGIFYSHTLLNLLPNTSYFFRITATEGLLSAVYTGSFRTAGAVEICDNGIDDDNNGFCDYPASNCQDGSVPGDPQCLCQADFLCTPQICRADNTRLVFCVDQSFPKCQPDYQYEESCGLCENVYCGICQELDETSCTCLDILNCCGNGICETPAEDPYNCPADCRVDCLSDWQCTDWQPAVCPENGIQSRECFDLNSCQIPINPPEIYRSCSEQCPGLTCGNCQRIDLDTCTCEQLIPCCGNGWCESGENYSSCPQDCVEFCRADWVCSGWSSCRDDVQTRQCSDLNSCPFDFARPPEIRSCADNCEIACSSCQRLDLNACRCEIIADCCGNRLCEENETVWSCPADCGISPNLVIVLPECLDGIDNDGDGLVDYPADPGCAGPSDNNEMNILEMAENIVDFLQQNVWQNEDVQKVNQNVAAPVLIAAVAVNTAASVSLFNFLSYLRYFFSEPLAALFRRRRRKWGIVYNSLTKQPIDLAIVRLYEKESGRLVQSRVTDKQGRYLILAEPGNYYLTVTKPKFNFPTLYLKEKKEDVRHLDLYHGETVEVTDQRASLTLNIPLDPIEAQKTTKQIILEYYLRKVQYAAAFSAVPLATISLAISPGFLTLGFLIFHILLYIFFKRLGYQKPPKSWGIVYDDTDRKPISRAITRIYDRQYNKLLETRVTDSKGRYSFLVDNNIYYITTEKPGYNYFKSNEIDLIAKEREAIVGLDIPLNKGANKEQSPADVKEVDRGVKNEETSIVSGKNMPPDEVDRDSLTKIMRRRQGDRLASDNGHEKNIDESEDSSTEFSLSPAEKIKVNENLKESQEKDNTKDDKGPEFNRDKSIFG